MSLLKKLSNLFTQPAKSEGFAYWFHVRCNRCGEVIRGRVDMRNDLSIDYGEVGDQTTYFVRKVLIGEKGCYQPIEVELTFDEQRKLIDKKIKGGQFVEN